MSERAKCDVISVTICPTCGALGQSIASDCMAPEPGHEERTAEDGEKYWVRAFAPSSVEARAWFGEVNWGDGRGWIRSRCQYATQTAAEADARAAAAKYGDKHARYRAILAPLATEARSPMSAERPNEMVRAGIAALTEAESEEVGGHLATCPDCGGLAAGNQPCAPAQPEPTWTEAHCPPLDAGSLPPALDYLAAPAQPEPGSERKVATAGLESTPAQQACSNCEAPLGEVCVEGGYCSVDCRAEHNGWTEPEPGSGERDLAMQAARARFGDAVKMDWLGRDQTAALWDAFDLAMAAALRAQPSSEDELRDLAHDAFLAGMDYEHDARSTSFDAFFREWIARRALGGSNG